MSWYDGLITEEKVHKPDTPVRFLKGVGPRMAEKLAGIGVATIEDLLRYYPRTWEDRRCRKKIRETKVGDTLALFGTLKNFDFTETPRGFAIASARIADDSGEIECRWLRRRSYQYDVLQGLKHAFVKDRSIMVYGEVGLSPNGKTVSVKEHQVLNGEDSADIIHLDRIVPVYPATEGLSVSFLRGLIHRVLPATELPDPLPPSVQSELKLMALREALEKIHFPKTLEEVSQARARLAFEELFMLQTVLAIARQRRRVPRDFSYEVKKTLLTPFRKACGFEFTPAQKRVILEIFSDLEGPHPMTRLIQGDVGSGKTVVAISAMLLAVENSKQAVLMAPTEILAEQHYITLKHLLKGLPVTVGLLTGSVKGKEKESFMTGCESGKIQIAVGTHALLEDDIRFANLSLVVIDEQHRFGVKHRLKLTRRKPAPDTLVMTATPIPRTLALGIYGDLDLSTIDQLPPGRQTIKTALMKGPEAYQAARQEIEKRRQVYVVCPLIDESRSKILAEEHDEMEFLPALDLESSGISKLKAAVQEFEKLKSGAFKGFPIALLHGRMSRDDKERTMLDFKAGNIRALVATTVIEVGIDVPNATVMVIQNAERFGLSTLHQLRGRVGRGANASFCFLVGQTKTEAARRRMDIILKSQNGFEIAEEDLKLRGPGEIFGVSQHGLPPFKIADFNRDLGLIQSAQRAAQALVEKDPNLALPEHEKIRARIRAQFSKSWFLASIG